MIQALIFLLPQETWICLLVLAGFLLMFGFRKAAVSLIGTIILLALFSPFIDALVESLPTWMLVLLMLLTALSFLRLVFGGRIADQVIAHLLYDILLLPFRFIGWLFRGSGRRI